MDEKQIQSPNQNQVEVAHFLPRQVILHLGHPPGMSAEDLAETLETFLQDKSGERSWRGQLEPPKHEKILAFPQLAEAQSAFSIVPTRMRNHEATKEDLISLVLAIHTDLMEPRQYAKGSTREPEKRLHPIPITPDGAITLNSVSPNWLIGGAYHQCGTVAPGSWPKSAPDIKEWRKFKIPEEMVLKTEEQDRGAGVTVAILDTAPCMHDLIDAYNYWHEHEDGISGHELIDSLLKPGGPLQVHPMTYEELIDTMDFSALRHRYRMADHGLFVAGIIHTIAPQAQLHLYESLNLYGTGSLESIARGLLHVLDLLASLRNSGNRRPLIVNCSLGLGVSVNDPDLPEQLNDEDLLEDMRISFEQMIALLDQDDVVVVAAAGNDAQREQKPDSTGQPEESVPAGRPPARYPAAFKQVIGVGALPREHPPRGQRHKAASYSNLADRPETTGYATFGGEPRAKNGVLGVYIGGFPRIKSNIDKNEQAKNILPKEIEYVRNDSGWAWWAGTSFAAPIISGLLAARWGEDTSRRASVVRDLLKTSATERTEDEERVIVVNQ